MSRTPIHICVIGPDRAGTTFFCSLFNNLDCVFTTEAFANYEVLKGKGDWPFEDKKTFIECFCRDAHSKRKSYALYKIIYHQMAVAELEQLFLPDSEMIKIVLTRNLLDMYISLQKAKTTKRWQDYDTSKVKVTFNSKLKFEAWANIRVDYMRKLKKVLDKNAYQAVVIDYEELHEHPSEREKLLYAVEKVRSVTGHDLGTVGEVKTTVQKQDRTETYREKVNNYTEMIRLIRGRTLELRNVYEKQPFYAPLRSAIKRKIRSSSVREKVYRRLKV